MQSSRFFVAPAQAGRKSSDARAARPRRRQPSRPSTSEPGRRVSAPTSRCSSDRRRDRSRPFQIAYKTYGTLNADKSNAILICHALTGDQYVASRQSGHRQGRLVGRRWSGPASRSTPTAIFVICANVLGGCMGSTGPGLDRSRRPASPMASTFPVITIARHGAGAGDAASTISASTQLFCRHRRLDGRHAGAGVGGELSRPRLRRRADRHRRASLRAEHRLPRGRPPGDHGRSRLVRRRATSTPARARAAASPWRAWPRTSPICRRRRCTRSSAATCRTATRSTFGFDADFQVESYLRHQGIDASSTASTPTPISTSPGRWTISTSPPTTAACSPMPSAARRRASASSPSPATGCIPTAESRAIVHALNAVGGQRLASSRSRPTSGHDAFLLDEPEFFAAIGGFLGSAARSAGSALTRMQRTDRRHDVRPSVAARRPSAHRRHGRAGLAGARRRLRRRRAAANCCETEKQVDGRGIELIAARRQRLRRARPVGHPGRRRPRPRRLPRRRLRLRDPVADASRRRAIRRSCCDELLRIGERAIVSFPNFGHWRVRLSLLLTGRMPVTKNLAYAWYDTPNIHFCTIRDFVELCDEIGAKIETRHGDRRHRPEDRHAHALVVLEPLRPAGVFVLSR